ncbi:hypothetical protein SSPO_058260 [Streptomyces antimycoticus]|uniref:Uncharacterized protein n=1 Tax=Streptomyces antimycoticus TaxID=68175 RepID=A0A499USZ1_9ACTN|nr:hypothetical protein SSPO_058260 [Streptomyces antimycoticus]
MRTCCTMTDDRQEVSVKVANRGHAGDKLDGRPQVTRWPVRARGPLLRDGGAAPVLLVREPTDPFVELGARSHNVEELFGLQLDPLPQRKFESLHENPLGREQTG